MKYRTCHLCGATLDFGEKCDCKAKKEEEIKRLAALYKTSDDGQMEICKDHIPSVSNSKE